MNIRNFSIVAHIDHGKSTLADRLLELTNTVNSRVMKEQVLDSMELERERGITIKMQPARMNYRYKGEDYTLNLIDTPGHIDFSYEVSRALNAVEGVLLVVDSTQGVQAQTITVLQMVKEQNLAIIPVLSKIDMPTARVDSIKDELKKMLDCQSSDILLVSGKTGEGVSNVLATICNKIPAPTSSSFKTYRSLIFDFQYSNHRGIMVYHRVVDGSVCQGDKLQL